MPPLNKWFMGSRLVWGSVVWDLKRVPLSNNPAIIGGSKAEAPNQQWKPLADTPPHPPQTIPRSAPYTKWLVNGGKPSQ